MVMQIFQKWLKIDTLLRNNIVSIHSIDGDLGVTDYSLGSADLYVDFSSEKLTSIRIATLILTGPFELCEIKHT